MRPLAIAAIVGSLVLPAQTLSQCDATGASDSAACINSAIAATSASGGAVSLPAGTYMVGSSLMLRAKTTLTAAGSGATTIRMKAGAGFPMIVGRNITGGAVTGLRLDGNRANVTGNSSAIVCDNCVDWNIASNRIAGFRNAAIALSNIIHVSIMSNVLTTNGVSGAPSPQQILVKGPAKNLRIGENQIEDGGLDGLLVSASSGGIDSVHVESNNVSGNGRIGIYIAGSTVHPITNLIVATNITSANRTDNINITAAANAVVQGNIAESAGVDGLVIDSCNDTSVSGNTVVHNGARGVYLTDQSEPGAGSTRNTIAGNLVYANNTAKRPGVSGIDLYNTWESSVSGNNTGDDASAPHQLYGIAESGTSDGNAISANFVHGNVRPGINVTGRNTEQWGNTSSPERK